MGTTMINTTLGQLSLQSLQPTHTLVFSGQDWQITQLQETAWDATAAPEYFSEYFAEPFTLLGTVEHSANVTQAMVLAQQFDQDILGDLGRAVRNFIDSGQIWALIIGVVIGYLIRGLSAY
ncbi:MAG: hypothetical protein AAF651_11865 [Cyanobacteria bacterium P01_C01_bin.73]